MQEITLKKRITKNQLCSADQVVVQTGWFKRLYQVAQRFEKDPTLQNKATLLGYISSVEYIVSDLTKKQ